MTFVFNAYLTSDKIRFARVCIRLSCVWFLLGVMGTCVPCVQDYLLAGPAEQERFHQQGLRRLSPTEVSMPSGRKLQTDTTVSSVRDKEDDAGIAHGSLVVQN